MSNVTLEIGGKSYPVACGDGEETHVKKLGAMIDAKFAEMADAKSPQEVQNFLFASLILADELHNAQTDRSTDDDANPSKGRKKSELRARIDQLTKENSKLSEERDALAKALKEAEQAAKTAEMDHQHEMFGEDVLATRLETLATKAESFADALENQSS